MPSDNTKVFVVHGRNEDLRKSMFSFLRSIGLKPIEWSQAIQMTGNTAPFIGDVLDAAFEQAQAVVVLLNGDDEAHLREEYHSEKMPDYERNLTPQARPNVIFEAGLALGRFPDRTVIVEVGELRPFSDIAGRHTIRLSNSTKKRQDLAQRLKTSGCNIDLSGTDWHTVGDFEVKIISQNKNEESVSNVETLEEETIDVAATIEGEENLSSLHPDLLKTILTIMEHGDADGELDLPDLATVLNYSTSKTKYLLAKLISDEIVYQNGPYYGLSTRTLDWLFETGKL